MLDDDMFAFVLQSKPTTLESLAGYLIAHILLDKI